LLTKAPITQQQVASSKQLPTNQRRTDNAEKNEPNEVHPEDDGMGSAYNQPIAASAKKNHRETSETSAEN
jgi:hypothetical protein